MEKCILRIKLKTPETQLSTSAPDKSNAAVLIEETAATDITSSSEEYIPESYWKDMKRKRGHKVYHKKGKKVKSVNDPLASVNSEDNFNLEPAEDDQLGSEIDPEPPNVPNTPSIMSNNDIEEVSDRPSGKMGRSVKVKLKSLRVSEPYRSSSDVQTPSETEKLSPQDMPNMNEAAAEKEGSAYSDGQTSEMHHTISEKLQRKTGSIKIKTSRGLGISKEIVQDRNQGKLVIPSQMPSKKSSAVADTAKTLDSTVPRNLRQREKTQPCNDPRYSERELSAALGVSWTVGLNDLHAIKLRSISLLSCHVMQKNPFRNLVMFQVIKKVMKMDAAGPFNTPVDPVALGIPVSVS